MENVAPTRQNFVTVCLMAHVPNQLIVGRIIDIVQGHGQLNHAEIGPEMTAIHRNVVDNKLTKLIADFREVCLVDPT